MTKQPAQIAEEFVNQAKAWNWNIEVRGGIITITKKFPAESKHEFSVCDSEGYSLLGMIPMKCGSVWGTDGGSIGGAIALGSGLYRLNKSGNPKRILAAIQKISR